MKRLLKSFKLLLFLIAGVVFGYLVPVPFIMIFKDDFNFTEYIMDLFTGEAPQLLLSGAVLVFLSFVVQMLLHELGHMIFGLASGFKFVSYRIGPFLLIKENGKYKIKRFNVPGTAGQCLMIPPEKPDDQINMFWYNIGGVLMNLLSAIASAGVLVLAIMYCEDVSFFVFMACFSSLFASLWCAIFNGIPMTLNGIDNDGMNIKSMTKSKLTKHAILNLLRINKSLQSGIRPKDMPKEWFEIPESIKEEFDYAQSLHAAMRINQTALMVDRLDFEEAYNAFAEIDTHRDKIKAMLVTEYTCDMAFCAMATGRAAEAKNMLSDTVLSYVKQISNVMPSKQRILFAMSLYLDGNREKAMEIYNEILGKKSQYAMQGEVASELAIMEYCLKSTTGLCSSK